MITWNKNHKCLAKEDIVLQKQLMEKETKLAVVGLGYVGFPLACAFSKHFDVLGVDVSTKKILSYQQGIDVTGEMDGDISEYPIEYTSDPVRLKEAKFIVVAVPTPVTSDKIPDLTMLINASTMIGKNLSRGSIIVFESTVYPGATEHICVPAIEKASGLTCGVDFKVGYSPERINPGDKEHRLENIVKIVSGMDEDTLEIVSFIYKKIIKAGIHPVSSIMIAEAAKLVENSQRDINIAFMNELSIVFERNGINSKEVLDAMNTKWNALGFKPGLVGGHCIGVDPYYFVYNAQKLGYHSQIIAAGRKVNDSMGEFVADVTIKMMVRAGLILSESNVYILGVTFKENCQDTRNSRVVDIVGRLHQYGIKVKAVDSVAEETQSIEKCGVTMVDLSEIKDADCLILAVPHEYLAKLTYEQIKGMYRDELEHPIFIDIKSVYDRNTMQSSGFNYWNL